MNEKANEVDLAALSNRGRPRLATLTLMRWGAIGGQAAALLVVHFGFGYPVPLLEAFAAVGASVLLNIVLTTVRPAQERLRQGAVPWLLAFDLVQLALLLYLTGGLGNPFAFLLLAPVTVSAMMLNLRRIAVLCGVALAAVTLLGFWHLPLPWGDDGLSLPPVYILGSWVALAVGIPFFAGLTWRVAVEARRMSHALSASQLALAREQQLTALGGLAAAAAHELGTPLGTIAVVSRELAREVPDDSPLGEDIELLIEQAERCRRILADLGRGPAEAASSQSPVELGLDALIETAALRHATSRVRLRFDAAPDQSCPDMPPPLVLNLPEVVHGIGNLVENAIQFARGEVVVVTRWSGDSWRVTVTDDGPGIAPRLLERLGEPYVSSRDAEGGHMGLGVFIARTLLELTGAQLTFSNRQPHGAVATVTWPPVPWTVQTAIATGREAIA